MSFQGSEGWGVGPVGQGGLPEFYHSEKGSILGNPSIGFQSPIKVSTAPSQRCGPMQGVETHVEVRKYPYRRARYGVSQPSRMIIASIHERIKMLTFGILLESSSAMNKDNLCYQ